MEKRIVKKTREELSPIGFGAMRLPSKNGKINYKESEKLIHHAIDNGINIIDTAAIYNNGESEKVLGKALKGEYRNKVKISTKLPAMNIKKYEDMEKILNEQLERLQIDCIDYYFLHNVDLKAMNRLLKKDVLKFLSKAKQEGKIKYVGFSYHGTTEEFPLLLDAYDWDMVMIQYNYFDNNVQADIEGIHHAASKGMGIFIMEPLKGGILAGKMPDEVESIFKKADPSKTNSEWSISWILNHPEITCVFSGMNNIAQIDENIAIGNSVEPHSMSLEELETIDYAKRALKELLQINCTSCGYCLPCPRGVNISECMKIYNEKYLFNQKGLLNQSLIDYYLTVSGIMIDSSNAGLCNGCGKCLRKCPQHLDIPKELDKVKKEFKGHFFKFKVLFVKSIGMKIYQKFF